MNLLKCNYIQFEQFTVYSLKKKKLWLLKKECFNKLHYWIVFITLKSRFYQIVLSNEIVKCSRSKLFMSSCSETVATKNMRAWVCIVDKTRTLFARLIFTDITPYSIWNHKVLLFFVLKCKTSKNESCCGILRAKRPLSIVKSVAVYEVVTQRSLSNQVAFD